MQRNVNLVTSKLGKALRKPARSDCKFQIGEDQ